jgi:hypothetical protein
MKIATCLHCKVEFSFGPSKTGKYCTNRCQMAFQHAAITALIESLGAKPEGVGHQRMRTYIIETRGHRCVGCSGTEWVGQPIPLVLDHIDGNSDNWSLGNLRMLCCNCDAQTETYKGKNRGNGRHSRRVRYAEGKSY